VRKDASPNFHSLCGALSLTECDIAGMADDKNGGPNYLRAWRVYRKLTQDQLAERVGTNANMIGYLESGERGLSAKWLRKLSNALETTPGMILEHDPAELDADILDIWAHGNLRQKRQLSEIAKTLIRTGTDN
jgi:transcriptional regulator with XRE-family HTH domain